MGGGAIGGLAFGQYSLMGGTPVLVAAALAAEVSLLADASKRVRSPQSPVGSALMGSRPAPGSATPPRPPAGSAVFRRLGE